MRRVLPFASLLLACAPAEPSFRTPPSAVAGGAGAAAEGGGAGAPAGASGGGVGLGGAAGSAGGTGGAAGTAGTAGTAGAAGTASTAGIAGTAGGAAGSAPAACANGVKDGGETDVDCGGPQCPLCGWNQACLVGEDCELGGCLTGSCGTSTKLGPAVTLPLAGNPWFAELDDLDGDGDLDAVIALRTGDALALVRNDGGTFTLVESVPSCDGPMHIQRVDADLDGDLDFAIACNEGKALQLRTRKGAFVLGPQVNLAANGPVWAVAVAKLPGPPNTTSLVSFLNQASGAPSVDVWTIDPTGKVAYDTSYPATALPAFGVAADLDLDGDDDLALVSQGATFQNKTLEVRLATGPHAFSGPTLTTGLGPRNVVARDLDGDGLPELVVSTVTSSTVDVFHNQGGGAFSTAKSYAMGAGTRWVALGDLDLDGDVDMATVDGTSRSISLRLGDGKGGFFQRASFALPSACEPRSVALSDVTHTPSLDVVVTCAETAGAGGGLVVRPTL